MVSSAHYSPVRGGHDIQETEDFELHGAIMRPSEEVEQEGTWLSPKSSVSGLDMSTQITSARVEPPPEFRALTLPDNAPDAKTRPEWDDPVRWCLWGNIAVLVINIGFTIAAVGVSAPKYGSLGFGSISIYQGSCSRIQEIKIGLHLLINVLSVAMTATSSYCCTILMAPSRADVDKAHSNGTWLSIGVSSWRNFRNLRKPSQVLWSLLLLTTIIMQMVYNSVVYSSLNANSYPALVAPLDFVSNSSVPTSFFEEQSCWPQDTITWTITDLRAGILNGSFEYLSKDDCIETYANSYISDRRTVVIVTQEPMTGKGISLAGYGYPGAIAAAIPTDNWNFFSSITFYSTLNPVGFEWMCYTQALSPTFSSCSSSFLQELGSWNVSSQAWPRLTSVHLPNIGVNEIDKEYVELAGKFQVEKTLMESNLTWTRKDLEAFLSYLQTNPPPEQMWSYLNKTSWIASAEPEVNVSTFCPTIDDLIHYDGGTSTGSLPKVGVQHCLSQKTPEECGLFYHLPIASAMIICNLIKVVCIWLLLHVNRRDLFLTIGDAISSFLQRPDPTTKQWCTLSMTKKELRLWKTRYKSLKKENLRLREPQPGLLPGSNDIWAAASSKKIWWLASLVLLLFLVICLALPICAIQNPLTHQGGDRGLNDFSIFQIKGWGAIQSTALVPNSSNSFVGGHLLASTPQLVVSLLYFCFNDTLTRMILAADYNNFAIHRRPLRVSFPRGEQRSTWYLTIPYQYAVPFLAIFTLIHWFISEGLFYVQIVPFNIHGKSIPFALLATCCVSTIPLELGLFLTISAFLVTFSLGFRKFKASKMPIACEWSVAISAACHPPRLDLDAAFKPVQWGVVENDADASYPHCSFTSKEVEEPEKDIQYA